MKRLLHFLQVLRTSTKQISTSGGVFTVKLKYEGLAGNGANASLVKYPLIAGFAMTFEAGVVNPAKYRMRFWRSSYVGASASNGLPYNGIAPGRDKPILLATSPEVSNISQLYAWMDKSEDFKNYFYTTARSTISTGVFSSQDLTDLLGYQLFAGGTQT